jgi:hypothetical protein
MKVLLIVQPDRFDFYNYLAEAKDIEWVLLWNEKPGQMVVPAEKLPVKFSKIIFWTDFITPKQIIDEIKPDRIVLFEIIDLRQIALIVTGNKIGVPTFYLEHGAAGDKDTAISRWDETTFSNHKLPYLVNRFVKSFWDVIKSKAFYFSALQYLPDPKSKRIYLNLPFKMLKGSPNKVLSHNIFRQRVPQKAIVFNQPNFHEFALYTSITEQDAILSGVPYFDKYYRPSLVEEDYVVYIEHPYFEENLIGWTEEHFNQVAKALSDFAVSKKAVVYVKLHPRSNKKLWDKMNFDSTYIKILQVGDFTELFLKAKLILGYSSSLITGLLCAKKNIVLLGWHPKPHIFGADFSKTNLCHLSFSISDLSGKYESWLEHNLAIDNADAYDQFLHQFNYPFDGKATARVIDAIKS